MTRQTKFNILKLIGEQTIKYSNLPERYIKRMSEQVYYKTPKGPQYWHTVKQRVYWKFGMHRPWTDEHHMANMPGKKIMPEVIEPIKDWSFFLGDRVEILIGKDKGKQGIVKQIFQEKNWITVDGLHTKLETIGKTKDISGVLVRAEQPLLVTTDVALVDPSDLCATPIRWQYTETGDKVRVSVRTGRIIPIPLTSESTIDYKFKSHYKDGAKDTTKNDVAMITFQPTLKTFEMDIMDKMGIKEDRIQKPFFWY